MQRWSLSRSPKPRTPMYKEASDRANALRSVPSDEVTDFTVEEVPVVEHPLRQQQETPISTNSRATPKIPATSSNTPFTPPSYWKKAEQARKEWKQHGEGISQVSEEKRRPQSSADIVVRIIAAETRNDLSGDAFVAYVVSVQRPGQGSPMLAEQRYSEFDKLHSVLRKHSVQTEASFPTKHWAGRMGNWTPSLSLSPTSHTDLVAFRKTALDLWLVDVTTLLNRGTLPVEAATALMEFLSGTKKAPCDRENDLGLQAGVERSLRLSNPLSYTLGSSVRQATYTLNYMCRPQIFDSDKSIPLDLLQQAKGLCFLTVFKAGLVVSGKFGTGLVIAKKPNGTWSAPSALGTVGLGWGAQIGGDVTHYLIVFTTQNAMDTLSASASVTLGAELGVAVGPVGRGATSHISTSSILQPAYAYAHSQGLFVGISLEGSIVNARQDVNTKFYGRNVEVKEILSYVDQPRAAAPLYEALDKALAQDIPKQGLRPSALFTSCSPQLQVASTPLKPSDMTGSRASTPASSSDMTPPSPQQASPTAGYRYLESPLTIENLNPGRRSLMD